MDDKRVLIAIEMRSYRESIAEAFREFCPNTVVFEVRSEDLDVEVKRLYPDFVLCTRASEAVRTYSANWVELYPDPLSQESEGSMSGRPLNFSGIQLADLFSMVDRLEALA